MITKEFVINEIKNYDFKENTIKQLSEKLDISPRTIQKYMKD